MTIKRSFCLLAVSFLWSTVFAGTTGKLAGRLTSQETGEPLIGVNVMIMGTTLGAATDLDGNFYVLQIPPGNYSVRFTMIGYQALVVNDVRIKVDLTTKVDGVLSESVVGLNEVVVQAERAIIQTDVTYSQANISSEEVDMLPVEEFEDVLALQAGVVSTGGEMHVRGGRGGEISYMIDGISVTDPYNAGVAVEIENNAIQELQFISGTFNAEYGQAMSGIVNIVTKDGDYYGYSGNMSVNGGSYFSNGHQVDVIQRKDSTTALSSQNIFPNLGNLGFSNISDFKGNLEGPIFPGKISFFASGRYKQDMGYLNGQRIFHPNSFVWVDSLNNWFLNETVSNSMNPNLGSLGNGYIPAEDDSLMLLIDSLRYTDKFEWVPMDWSEQLSTQFKLSWEVTQRLKMSFNRMESNTHSQSYFHSYRWNPDGRPHAFSTNIGNLFRADLSLNQSTFANVMFSQAENHYRSHLSNDPDFYKNIHDFSLNPSKHYNQISETNEVGNDSSLFFGIKGDDILFEDSDKNHWKWNGGDSSWTPVFDTLSWSDYKIDPRIFDYTTGNNFYVGGQSMGVYSRKSIVNTMKAELTSQINKEHQIKSGVEYRKTKITLADLNVLYNSNTGFNPYYYSPLRTPTHDTFGEGRTPVEMSAYLQDKIEQDQMVVNIGLRYDYFDPDWKVVNDPEDPNYLYPLKPINKWHDVDGDTSISESEMTDANRKSDDDRLAANANGDPWFRDADPKKQFSPRFALAFPITEKGYMHFSYGHFFQNPSFNYIYDNPEFEVPAASGISNTMGNADMEPQRTTQYEVGFSQQIGSDIGIEVTGYFKDIRNLNSTEIKKSFIAGDRYGMYVNKDHANSRGITLAVSKRSLQGFSGNVDYTYSVSEGNASDPTAAFYDEQADIEPEKILVPLDWDQRHTINGTMTYHPIPTSGISLVFNFGSGFPYTTEFIGIRTAFENNGLKPATFNVDMRSYINIPLSKKIQLSAHINVYNLFDIRNELTVYNDTGRSTYSLVRTYTPQYSGPQFNSLDEFQVRPDYYSAPRQIKAGLSVALF